MKRIKVIVLAITAIIGFSSYGQKTNIEKAPKQSFVEHTPTAHHQTALEVLKASKDWIRNFNAGNVEACVMGYDATAILSATPYGLKKGTQEISGFWTPFMASGATNIIYTNVSIEVVNDTTAFLAANWSMNVGRGVIYQEKWEKKEGKWVLTYDDFEVLEQFKTPKENRTGPTASHTVLEEVIMASIEWTNGFNTGKSDVCGNGYSENATMNAVPFASINGREGITGFWAKMISDGATNLTYHNPIFKAVTENSVSLASDWSMNIGEGKIYQEKWKKQDDKWFLTYDEFQVLKQY